MAAGRGDGEDEAIGWGLDAGCAERVAVERHFDHRAAACVACLHVGDEIAERVDHQHVLVVAVAVAHLHRLYDMWMAADDEVYAKVGEVFGEPCL